MQILDGKKTSEQILKRISKKVEKYLNEGNRVPRLDIIIVGNDFASEKYVSMKEERGKELGIKVVIHKFESNTDDKEIISLIQKLNEDSLVDGIMVQLPLPKDFQTYNTKKILENIEISKDVDG